MPAGGTQRREVFGSEELLDAFIGSRDLEIVHDNTRRMIGHHG